MMAGNLELMSTRTVLRHMLQFAVVYMLLASTVFGHTHLGIHKGKTFVREKRNAGSSQGQAPHTNDQLMNVLQEYDTNNVDVNLLRYTPTTPSPEDVNCYVEVPVTRRVGGRCTLLGSSTWGCQAGIFLAFNSECQNEAAQLTAGQAGSDDTGPSSGGSRGRNPFRRRRRPSRR